MKYLFALLASIPVIVHSGNDIWVDVLPSLTCENIGAYRGDNGRCYHSKNDKIIQDFIEYEQKLKESVIYPWTWNHGRDKRDLDKNPYYRSQR